MAVLFADRRLPERPLVSVSHAVTDVVTNKAGEVDLGRVTALAVVFAQVSDPRKPKGIRHPLAAVLTVLTMALLCGARDFRQAADRVAELPEALLEAAGARRQPVLGIRIPPGRDTLCPLSEAIDAAVMGPADLDLAEHPARRPRRHRTGPGRQNRPQHPPRHYDRPVRATVLRDAPRHRRGRRPDPGPGRHHRGHPDRRPARPDRHHRHDDHRRRRTPQPRHCPHHLDRTRRRRQLSRRRPSLPHPGDTYAPDCQRRSKHILHGVTSRTCTATEIAAHVRGHWESKTASTGSVTSSSAKTPTTPTSATSPTPWPPYATSPSP
ncbi:transposase family protein [Actinoplanes solisilvae]|uniref:transposase family protein n=1 Tax=Actinoplanes solisilvae TaxID=2486853 RepID=UPI000FD85A24